MLHQWEASSCCYLAWLAVKHLIGPFRTWQTGGSSNQWEGFFFKTDSLLHIFFFQLTGASWRFTCCAHVAAINQLFALVAEAGDKTGGCSVEHGVRMKKKHCFPPFYSTFVTSTRYWFAWQKRPSEPSHWLPLPLSACLLCVRAWVRACISAKTHPALRCSSGKFLFVAVTLEGSYFWTGVCCCIPEVYWRGGATVWILVVKLQSNLGWLA